MRSVTKRFGARVAVQDLTLDVESGEIFGLLGHNGAGKSTAIGMMLGQVWPTSGEVIVCGHDVTRNRRRALERVGAIFETPAFYDYLSGWSNLVILASYTAPTSKQRIKEVIDWVGLSGREHSRVKTYSHGMRARLALAQALLPKPDLLLLDEPNEGLDPEGIHEMRQTILRLHRELGLTILLSSHLLHEVQQLCTRIAVIRSGRKVYEGPVAEARRSTIWWRLVTDNFDIAVARLRAAGLVKSSTGQNQIELADGVASDRVVRFLVESGFNVHEIAREESTLEAFYLSLMRDAESAPEANADISSAPTTNISNTR
ncbi:MAG TPA: ABC transporter ATP-binding protein [Verrucomicrobiota bacterium]|nr:ABC transporter ATP-binding protein [Verrucomicrobiota bacterium]